MCLLFWKKTTSGLLLIWPETWVWCNICSAGRLLIFPDVFYYDDVWLRPSNSGLEIWIWHTWMFSCSEIYKSLNKQKRVNDFSAYGRFDLINLVFIYLHNSIYEGHWLYGKNFLVLKTHAKFSCWFPSIKIVFIFLHLIAKK